MFLSACATNAYQTATYRRITHQRLDTVASEPGKLLAGAAKVDITPPVGMPLQGYGARRGEPSRGVRDPLYARVLVLKNSQAQLVLVSCDVMAVTDNLTEAVFQKVKSRMPVAKRELILFATHTHSGAGGLSNRFAMQFVGGRFRPGLFRETTDKIAAAIIDAIRQAEPAQIASGDGEVADLNQNRAWADGAVDRQVKTLRVTNAQGKSLAWLVNFAAHPTILGVNWEFSADFPGYLASDLEHDGAVCLFANGAAGDLNIGKQNDASRDARAERAGKTLATKAVEIVPSHTKDSVAIESRLVSVVLPPVRLRACSNSDCALPSWVGDRVFPREVPIQVARIDHTLLLAAPVEFCAEIGLELKQAASKLSYDLLIIGYANDYIGYVVPERYYATKAYESRTSFYGPKLDSYLKEVCVKMMEAMPR